MEKMLPKFVRKHGAFRVLELVKKTCAQMAEEAAESGKLCNMETEGFSCSSAMNAEARAVEKCLNDIHRYKSCPCWVGGRNKSWI